MSPKVAVIGMIRFPANRMWELRPHLKALVDATYRLDGCVAYDAAEDPFDPGLIRFSELWPDHETLARHLQAPHLAPWRIAAHQCGAQERKFMVYDISGSREL